MSLKEPYPELAELLASIGEGGRRVAGIDAGEGAAGNISIFVGWPLDPRRQFPIPEAIALPVPVPHLAGGLVIVTGSGRRLRDIGTDPAANLAVVRVAPDGVSGTMHTSVRRLFEKVTSEWNSHLAVHDDTVARTGTNFHAVVHAQPPHLVYLSHLASHRDEAELNRRLLRWEPETIVALPSGIGSLPFAVPGSQALMDATVASLRSHRITVWGKHGVVARSDLSVTRAVDRIEYAETAARYEYMDLVGGGRAEGLTPDELHAVVTAYDVRTDLA